jgi:hypothetical protein
MVDDRRLRISGDRDNPSRRAQLLGEVAANRRQFFMTETSNLPTDENPLVKTLNPPSQASNRDASVLADPIRN